MKGAIKICDITESHTDVSIFYLQERLLCVKALSSTLDWPEAADYELSEHMGCFGFHSMSLKPWPFMNRRHAHMLVLSTFICLHFWKQ